MPRPIESGTTVGRGRREDVSFASPAGRVSRDVDEGISGNGQPPVGSIARIFHPSVEEKEVLLHPPPRPATSLGTTSPRKANSTYPATGGLRQLSKPKSVENMGKSANNELAGLRARLRPLQKSPANPPPSEKQDIRSKAQGHKAKQSQEILEELDDLLVNALERQATGFFQDDSTKPEGSRSATGDARTSQAPVLRPTQPVIDSVADTAGVSTLQSRLHSIHTGRDHHKTASTISMDKQSTTDESAMPRSSPDSDRVEYAEMPTEKTPSEQPVQQNDFLPLPKSTTRAASPIKARAAAFEKMQHDKNIVTSLPHDHRSHHSQHRGPKATTSAVSSIREKLETRHHPPQETHRGVHTPPIALALPQLIRRSQRGSASSRSASGGYDTAPESSNISCLPTPPLAAQLEPVPPTQTYAYQERKVSMPWPFKMSLFRQDKAAPATARTFHEEARADPERDEHVADTSFEHIKRHMNASPSKSASSRICEPSQKELRERISNVSLHESLQQRTDSERGANATRSEPRTPKKQSVHESGVQTPNKQTVQELAVRTPKKQSVHESGMQTPNKQNVQEIAVQTPKKQSVHESGAQTSNKQNVQEIAVRTPKKQQSQEPGVQTPRKSATPVLKSTAPAASSPASPFRGRSRAERAERRGRETYVVEQRYSLSRSRSRGRVKIQVEVRSPEASPDRPDRDHLIIIRANIEPVEEEE